MRLRRQVLQKVLPALAPHPDQPPPKAKAPVIIAGLLTSRTGLGEGARLAYRTFACLDLPVRAINLSPLFNSHHGDSEMPTGAKEPDLGCGTLFLHLNAPYTPYVLRALGAEKIKKRYVIGYWAWELPKLPSAWRVAQNFLHEIWVPSRFVADAVRADLSLPVRIVPHPVHPVAPLEGARESLGIDPDRFVVFSMANLASGFQRKNPLGAIAAFRRAFGDDPSALLALKLGDTEHFPAERKQVIEAIADAPNITLIEGRLSPTQVHSYYSASDLVLSLHRSEGFGLLMAEAMARGRAVVATGWSGNMDFMDESSAALVPYRLVPVEDPQKFYDPGEGPWADPDIKAAAQWLRKLRADPALRHRLASAGLESIKTRLSGESYRRAIEILFAA